MAGIGDNSGALLQYIEQIESLAEEKQAAADRQKEIFAEAKSEGYDTKIMRKVIARRKRDKDDLAEEESLIELYEANLVDAAARMME